MDPNNPNNQGQAQGGVPPLDPSDPTPDQLTPEALYGPSTPGVDPSAGVPNSAAPAPMGGLTDPMQMPTQDMTQPMDPSLNDPNAMPAYQDAVPDADLTQDTLPPQEAQPDLSNPYYEDPNQAQDGAVPLDPNAAPPAPPEGVVQAGGLPPIPSRSKLPFIIIGVVVLLVIIVGISLFFLSRRGGSSKPSPTPATVELTCEEDPSQVGCETTVPEKTVEPTPSPTTSPMGSTRPTLSPQQCQLLYGGPCP